MHRPICQRICGIGSNAAMIQRISVLLFGVVLSTLAAEPELPALFGLAFLGQVWQEVGAWLCLLVLVAPWAIGLYRFYLPLFADF
jgi:hypothetical protein